VLNVIFVITVLVRFLIATGAFDDAGGAKDQAKGMQKSMTSNMTGGGGGDGNPVKILLKKILQKIMNKVGKVIVDLGMKYLMAPFRWLAQAKADLEKEVPRLQWVGVGQPLEVVEHHPGLALRAATTGYYLAANLDSTLRVLKRWPRGPGKPPVMAFDIIEQGDEPPLLMSKHGTHGYDSIEHREVQNPMGVELLPIPLIVVTVDGEEYRAEDPPKVRCSLASLHNGALLRAWASRHYILDGRSQRAYIARAMGTCLDILLVKTCLSCIPDSLNDIVCLMTIAARRVTNQGNQVELTKAASRRHVLEEMEGLLEFKRNEIKEKAEKAAKGEDQQRPKGKLSKKSTFSALSFEVKEKPDFTVTAEELTVMNCLLQRCDATIMFSLLTKSMDILRKAEAQLEEDEQERAIDKPLSNETRPSVVLPKRKVTDFSLLSGCTPVDREDSETH